MESFNREVSAMNVLAFNRAVASNLVSMVRVERTIQRQQLSEAARDESERQKQLAEIERENARAIRVAQSAIMGSSFDLRA